MEQQTMRLEEYIKLLETSTREDIVKCGLGDNQTINTNLAPTQIRDGLLRTNKFEKVAEKYLEVFNGKFHLGHTSTNTLVLIRYHGDSEDKKRGIWTDPEPIGRISIHPNQANLRGYTPTRYFGDVYQALLTDLLHFGKAERCRLQSYFPMPGNEQGTDLLNVEFNP